MENPRASADAERNGSLLTIALVLGAMAASVIARGCGEVESRSRVATALERIADRMEKKP